MLDILKIGALTVSTPWWVVALVCIAVILLSPVVVAHRAADDGDES